MLAFEFLLATETRTSLPYLFPYLPTDISINNHNSTPLLLASLLLALRLTS
jgi:hypothetical protein